MIQIEHTERRNIKKIAEIHYGHLRKFLVSRIENLRKRRGTKMPAKLRSANLTARQERQLDGLCDKLLTKRGDRYPEIRKLILCPPKSFPRRHIELHNRYDVNDYVELMKFVFRYRTFETGLQGDGAKYSGFDLLEQLGVKTCVYCNRQYINPTNDKDAGKRVKPALDHFFPQAEYPLFGLSFYNLIPACTFCNSSFKGATPFNVTTHVHPYLQGFGSDAVFKFCITSASSASTPLKILDKGSKKGKRIERSALKFCIDAQYTCHSDLANEIREKNIENSADYFESIKKILNGVETTSEEFYKHYFGNFMNPEDHEKRPLAKFTRDLVDDLGIMKKAGYR